jgi:hypothetical protein
MLKHNLLARHCWASVRSSHLRNGYVIMCDMNFRTFDAFFPQSKHCVGSEHLLVTEHELSGWNSTMMRSPQDKRFTPVEATT